MGKELILLAEDELPKLIKRYQDISDVEKKILEKVSHALTSGLPDAALTYLWNATQINLQRKIEAYGIDIYLASFDGKKIAYRETGDTLHERWERINCLDLIEGCENIGIISKKGRKALEFINWLRNHCSAAHTTDEEVDEDDLKIAIVTVMKEVFSKPLPEPAFNFKMIIEPLKTQDLTKDSDRTMELFSKFNQRDASTCLSMLVSLCIDGDQLAINNAMLIIPVVWLKASEQARQAIGQKYFEFYHNLYQRQDIDVEIAKQTIFDIIKLVKGFKYIPGHLRTDLYAQAIRKLQLAKDRYYGWRLEEQAINELEELGLNKIPQDVFEEVSIVMIRVYCGNQWGRSDAFLKIEPFIDTLNNEHITVWINLLKESKDIHLELSYTSPNNRAIELTQRLEASTSSKKIIKRIADVRKKIKFMLK